jgi:hypothetical protein
VTWVAPTANTDGTALSNISGYRIYYGTSATSLTQSVDVNNAMATSYVIQGLTSGTWYFAVQVLTSSGTSSAVSTAVSDTI